MTPTEAASIHPIADTASANQAVRDPAGVLAHYGNLAGGLWSPPALTTLTGGFLGRIGSGSVAWATLTGPFGYGKTAAGVCLWRQADAAGFLAVPPLACSGFADLAAGIAALVGECMPEMRDRSSRCLQQTGLQARRGKGDPEGAAHRLVEFLADLAGSAVRHGRRGLVVVLDELQQLLGPLDVQAVGRLRDFIWGMRTERTAVGLALSLDERLEGRLQRWAADVLHRVREQGSTLRLADAYTRDFPEWLWQRVSGPVAEEAIRPEVLRALGQWVERPDLSAGPRTVADVLGRALTWQREHGRAYGLAELADDLHAGGLRFPGADERLRRELTRLLTDEWIASDPARRALARTLALFPAGASVELLRREVGEPGLTRARGELFGPLLVETVDGLALEALRPVRRELADEASIARCWEALPGASALAELAPTLVRETLLPVVFPCRANAADCWLPTGEPDLTGWQVLRGTFDTAFPLREWAVAVSGEEPTTWPEDVDGCLALVCRAEADARAAVRLTVCQRSGTPRVVCDLPVMRPLAEVLPPELERHRKHLEPEPLRPATLLAALRELGDDASQEMFRTVCVDVLLRELLAGEVEVTPVQRVWLRGLELVRAVFGVSMRARYPAYQTLRTGPAWRAALSRYREVLADATLSEEQRQGRAALPWNKAEACARLAGQESRASGESVLRGLGALAEVTEQGGEWSLRLTPHPAEAVLVGWLRRVASQRGVPTTGVTEVLRQGGYLPDEAEEVVALSTARGQIVVDADGLLRRVVDSEVELAALREQLQALNGQLRRFGEEEVVGGVGLVELQKAREEAKRRRDARLRSEVDAIKAEVARVVGWIGQVRAVRLPTAWSESELAAHLRGVTDTLGRTQPRLLHSLRELVRRLEEEQPTGEAIAEWGLRWLGRRSVMRRGVSQCCKRVEDFVAQAEALIAWGPANKQLRSARLLAEQAIASDPGTTADLAELVSSYRERFATEPWGPLFAVAEFRGALGQVTERLQSLLFTHARRYLEEVEVLRHEFGSLLPMGLAPSIGETTAWDVEIFQKLYCWVLTGFRQSVERAEQRRQVGTSWVDPQKRRRFSEVARQANDSLLALEGDLRFGPLTDAGRLVRVLAEGFGPSPNEEVHDSTVSPPDFDELRRLFLDGRITIRVEARRTLPTTRE